MNIGRNIHHYITMVTRSEIETGLIITIGNNCIQQQYQLETNNSLDLEGKSELLHIHDYVMVKIGFHKDKHCRKSYSITLRGEGYKEPI